MPNGPKTPTSPISPTFASSATIFPSYYLTGDSIRDKCIEMVSGALKMDEFLDEDINGCAALACKDLNCSSHGSFALEACPWVQMHGYYGSPLFPIALQVLIF
ncbi:UNVERIFIED_CONTAM: hypothetical protein K2H54_053785 [Gekko kuhli]